MFVSTYDISSNLDIDYFEIGKEDGAVDGEFLTNGEDPFDYIDSKQLKEANKEWDAIVAARRSKKFPTYESFMAKGKLDPEQALAKVITADKANLIDSWAAVFDEGDKWQKEKERKAKARKASK